MLGRRRRLVLLAEGRFVPTEAKTAIGVLRYRPQEVVAVLDSEQAGRTAAECVGVGGAIPVIALLADGERLGADGVLIGVAPQGGELQAEGRRLVADALARGWDVLSGLHVFLGDDPELAALAQGSGARILDVRRPPAGHPIAAGRGGALASRVVLTVGSDCNVGKMTAALEIARSLDGGDPRVVFVATGQTGIFVADAGVTVDAVPADFIAGHVETLVLEAAREAGIVIVEGQGSLHHPGYSGVTLGLLHGACPSAMVLCHQVGRTRIRVGGPEDAGWPVPPLAEMIAAYETAASWVAPARVIGVALNTVGLDERVARAACEQASRETGLPATDPVRFGAAPLAAAVLAFHGSRA